MANSNFIGKEILWKGRYYFVLDADNQSVYAIPSRVGSEDASLKQPILLKDNTSPVPRVKIPISEIVQVILDVYEFGKLHWPWFKRIFETIKSWFNGKEKK